MVRSSSSGAGMWVQSLAREPRSHMPHGKKSIKQKQCCNKFNKDFKSDPHKKRERGFHRVLN